MKYIFMLLLTVVFMTGCDILQKDAKEAEQNSSADSAGESTDQDDGNTPIPVTLPTETGGDFLITCIGDPDATPITYTEVIDGQMVTVEEGAFDGCVGYTGDNETGFRALCSEEIRGIIGTECRVPAVLACEFTVPEGPFSGEKISMYYYAPYVAGKTCDDLMRDEGESTEYDSQESGASHETEAFSSFDGQLGLSNNSSSFDGLIGLSNNSSSVGGTITSLSSSSSYIGITVISSPSSSSSIDGTVVSLPSSSSSIIGTVESLPSSSSSFSGTSSTGSVLNSGYAIEISKYTSENYAASCVIDDGDFSICVAINGDASELRDSCLADPNGTLGTSCQVPAQLACEVNLPPEGADGGAFKNQTLFYYFYDEMFAGCEIFDDMFVSSSSETIIAQSSYEIMIESSNDSSSDWVNSGDVTTACYYEEYGVCFEFRDIDGNTKIEADESCEMDPSSVAVDACPVSYTECVGVDAEFSVAFVDPNGMLGCDVF